MLKFNQVRLTFVAIISEIKKIFYVPRIKASFRFYEVSIFIKILF